MSAQLLFQAALLLSFFSHNIVLAEKNTSHTACPTWTYQEVPETECQCGPFNDVVQCSNITLEVMVKRCFCMTYSRACNKTLLGICGYNCYLGRHFKVYYSVPKDRSKLNKVVCGRYNRQGQMCSQCTDKHGVSVYSYDHYCAECTQYTYNWAKYLLIAYLPVTLLYMATLCFRINITKSSLYSYMLVSQLMTTTNCANLLDIRMRLLTKHELHKSYEWPIRIFFSLYAIWNLDFGRFFYHPFCLHPSLSSHQAIALDYLIAVYPLLLILLTYLLVRLHDKYRLAVLICRPFYCCTRRFQKEWNIKASLIDVFATFILLSNVKLLNVSFDLISVPIALSDMNGSVLPEFFTYTNGSMVYLGREHLPYFVLGVAVILVFNVLPILLLCLYPCRCFQRCLNYCSLSSPSLHIFMDAFQGCYKTTPPARDYRRMAALPLIVILLSFFAFSFTSNNSYFTLLGCILSFVSFIINTCRPFKKEKYNTFHALIYTLASLAFFLLNKVELPYHSVPLMKFAHFVIHGLDWIFVLMITLSVLLFWITNSRCYYRLTVCFKKSDEQDHLLQIN